MNTNTTKNTDYNTVNITDLHNLSPPGKTLPVQGAQVLAGQELYTFTIIPATRDDPFRKWHLRI